MKYFMTIFCSFWNWIQKDLEHVNWLAPEDTLEDVKRKHVPGMPNGPKEGDSVFLEKEHECECPSRVPDFRYKAVLRNGAWTKEKMPWRMY